MSRMYSTSDNEISFLANLRKGLAPDAEEQRSRHNFQDIFASQDDRQVIQRIESREELDRQGLVSSFKENSTPLNLNVHVVASSSEAAEIISDIAKKQSPEFGSQKHIIQHVHPDIAALRLWDHFAEEPITLHTTYRDDQDLREKTEASYIGITAADWGIAESATLIQITRPGMPRSTSLVPSIHIGLLRRSNILANLSEGYAMLRREKDAGSITFISGPSKTADIEAHMVHGAHGPREMHVVIVED